MKNHRTIRRFVIAFISVVAVFIVSLMTLVFLEIFENKDRIPEIIGETGARIEKAYEAEKDTHDLLH